jgi:O-antigen ligase
MATLSSESASIARRTHLIPARAARVVRAVARLLLAALLLLPVHAFVTAGVPLGAAPAIVVALFVLTLVRPDNGLLVCAGLLVLSGPLAAVVHCDPYMAEPLLLAFLAGWLLRETIRSQAPADRATRWLVTPALLLAAVVAASVLVQLMVQQAFVDYPWPFLRQVIVHLGSDYIVFGSRFPGLDQGAAMLEGIGLFVAATTLARRDRLVARRTIAMAAAAAAGVAALNVSRFAAICLRTGVPVLVNLRTTRVSAAFADFNAAGSYLAMALFLTLGLSVSARRVLRWVWIGSASLVLLAVWLTGSRAALIAVPAGAILFAWFSRERLRSFSRRTMVAVVGSVVLVVLLGAWFFPSIATGRNPFALQARVEMGEAALRMFRSHPVFGIGIGRFWESSTPYIDSAFRARILADRGVRSPTAERENAHNNYLQILAELGLVGVGPFLWLLAAIARQAWRAGRGRDAMLAGLIAAVLTFLLTCLTGHPLLIREVAAAFWLVLGVVAALSLDLQSAAADAAERSGRRPRLLVAGAVVCLAISVPVRAYRVLGNEAPLERAAIGVSGWQFDDQGVRFRTMTGQAEFYVPGSACELHLPLRVDPGGRLAMVEVEIRVDGQPANRVRAVRDSWRELRMLMPIDSNRRFHRIELRTSPGVDAVRLGKPELAACTSAPR